MYRPEYTPRLTPSPVSTASLPEAAVVTEQPLTRTQYVDGGAGAASGRAR